MGVRSRINGYIAEAWPGAAGGGVPAVIARLDAAALEIRRNNEDVLQALPLEDQWPPVCRSMFGWPPADVPMIAYRNRLIHLAGSLKEVDWSLRTWLDKFESLLQRLYWESAYARVELGYLGIHEFTWRANERWIDALRQGYLKPIIKWTFSGTMSAADLDQLRD
jgi:hypothetical protein